MRRGPRSDAIANREKLLTAALRTLQRDATAPMAVIAREAGVGVGTLYRHYRDRGDVLDALQVRSIGMVLHLLDDILSRDDPGVDAVREFLRRTVEHGAELFLPHHGAPPSRSPEYERLDRCVWERAGQMVRRGVADGTLRDDLSAHDVIMFGSLIAAPLPAVDDWPAVAGRQIDLFLSGIRRPGPPGVRAGGGGD